MPQLRNGIVPGEHFQNASQFTQACTSSEADAYKTPLCTLANKAARYESHQSPRRVRRVCRPDWNVLYQLLTMNFTRDSLFPQTHGQIRKTFPIKPADKNSYTFIARTLRLERSTGTHESSHPDQIYNLLEQYQHRPIWMEFGVLGIINIVISMAS